MNNLEKLHLVSSAISFMINLQTIHDEQLVNTITAAFKNNDKAILEKLYINYKNKLDNGEYCE